MEERKQKEIEYYDKGAEEYLENRIKRGGCFQSLNPTFLESYIFLYNFLKNKCFGKKILDYGCGDGMHSIWLASHKGDVTAIDLSKNSLYLAQKTSSSVRFILMDCEKLEFDCDYFDIVFEAEIFPSLDLDKAFSEINRVLKPGGFLIGIETLGHNPLTNLKRNLEKRRPKWARSHILKMKDFKKMKKYFNKIEIDFFHFVSWIVFPFVSLPGGKSLLRLFEAIDRILIFVFPFLKRYCFKVVFRAYK